MTMFFDWGCFPKKLDDRFVIEELRLRELQFNYNSDKHKLDIFREGVEKSRKLSSALLNIENKTKNIIFTSGTLNGFAMILNTFFNQGDSVLTTDVEFPDVYPKFYTRGLKVKLADILDKNTTSEIIESVVKNIDKDTKLLNISHCSYIGIKVPINEIAQQAKAKKEDILIIVDGAQAFGNIEIDLKNSKVDFYVGDYHKFANGGIHTGFIYIKDENNLQKLIEREIDNPFNFSDKLNIHKNSLSGPATTYLASNFKALEVFMTDDVQKVLKDGNKTLSLYFREKFNNNDLYPTNSELLSSINSIFNVDKDKYKKLIDSGVLCSYFPEHSIGLGNHKKTIPPFIRFSLNCLPWGNSKEEVNQLAEILRNLI